MTGPDHQDYPAWSPDGKKLAFSANYTGTFLIYILDMETREITGFAPSTTGLRLPHWSPDGRYIAYVESHGDHEELWVQAVDSSDPPLRLVTIDNRPDKGLVRSGIQDFAWSPDSSQIALEAYGDYGEGDGSWCAPIVINRDGSNLRLLGNWEDPSYFLGCGNRSRSPTWSPDSQWIAFSQKDPAITTFWHYNLFKTRHDGSVLERIIHIDPSKFTDYLNYLAWSPDGKYLVFSVDPGTVEVDNSLQLIDLSSKEITHLVDGVDHFGTPNGNIMYLNSAGTFTIGEQFNLPADEEVVVVFRLSEHRFKIYGSDGALLVDILLPAEWFNHGTPAERWWVLGDAWSDSLHKVGLQVFDLCYSESP